MNLNKNLLGRICRISLFAALLAAFAIPASAQTIYDNGPTNGGVDAWTINFGFEVSDSFVVTGSTTTAEGVTMGVWEIPGYPMTGVDWAIGTSPYDSSDGSGTAAGGNLSDTFQYVNGFGYDIDSVSFNLSSAPLAPGTYYLSLQNAVGGGEPIYWDENNGPSAGYESTVGNLNAQGDCTSGSFTGGTCSEAFAIYANPTVTGTPEPATLSLLGTGLLFVLGLGRRRIV